MAVLSPMRLMSLVVVCAFGTLNGAKAESSMYEDDVEHMEYEGEDEQNPHQQMMMERHDKLMKMEPAQERRDELIENHKNKMMDRRSMENHERMIDPEEKERREEMIEEHQTSLGDHADRMKNRAADEESPNPGEPVIP